MKLFPYVLIRVSGGPFPEWQRLNVCRTAQIVHEMWACQTELRALSQKVYEDLYAVISTVEQVEVRTALIRLRRAVLREGDVAPSILAQVQSYLPSSVKHDIHRYGQQQEKHRHLSKQGEAVYSHEVARVREHLRDLVQHDNIQMGLILSSQSLLKFGIPSYLETKEISTKRDMKTEQSLIKYLSRIYTKTSPFSTFTNLAIAQIDVDKHDIHGEQGLWHTDKELETNPVSHIRLNNYLYQYIKGLLTANRDIYRWLPVRPNPTLLKEKQYYVFLTNSNNVEAFQRIAWNPVLDLFHNVALNRQEGVLFDDIVHTIVTHGSIDATAEEIATYLDNLIAYGFLEFDLGVSGTDPDWDLKLCDHLRPLQGHSPLVQALVDTLARMRQLATDYGHASVERRQHILEEAYDVFKTVCMTLHKTAGLPEEERLSPDDRRAARAANEREAQAEASEIEGEQEEQEVVFRNRSSTAFYFQPEKMFYEDTSLAVAPLLDNSSVRALTTSLHQLLQATQPFEGTVEERERMCHYFRHTYGERQTVSLLRFYEDYYRDVKKPALAQQAPAQQPMPDRPETPTAPEAELIPAMRARQAYGQAWLNQLVQEMGADSQGHTGQLHLRPDHIIRANQACSMGGWQPPGQHSSYGAFIQPFYMGGPTGPQLMGVVNATFPGFGKMSSRFLHLFDQAVTQELCQWNTDLSRDALLIEDSDASYFNANLHPPLMPFEIRMPGGHNSLPPKQQIPVTELAVHLDEEHDVLRLIHTPSQQPAYVFDLGFQSQRGRSPLFRLLERFSLTRYLSYRPLLGPLNKQWQASSKQIQTDEGLWRTPRILYDDRLVIQRQAWHVPVSLLPLRQAQESDWAYFARVNVWRLTHQMPNEVFVYLFDRHGVKTPRHSFAHKMSRDDYKPQYICFANPFLVNLFAKLLHKVPDVLKIEEMLPNSEQLLSLGARPRVTEWMMQWYTTEGEER
jgi:hypothetical protein